MAISGISLRNITKHDLEFVRKLRNENRKQFFNTKIITKKAQQEWWNNYQPSDVYIICLDLEPIGVISESWRENIEISPRHYVGLHEVGNLMLSKEHQGKGYMTEAIRQITSRGGFFIAFVKPKNKSSLALFERAKFWRTDNES